MIHRIAFLLLLLCSLSCCSKNKTIDETPQLIRLEQLLENPSTEIESHFAVSAAEFSQYAGAGWSTDQGTIRVLDKKAVLLLPESPWRRRGFRLKFRVRSPVQRNLAVLVKGKVMAKYHLTARWSEQIFTLTDGDFKKPNVKQLQFAFDGPPAAVYAEFQELQFPLYSWGRTRVSNEVRSAFSVGSNAKARFQVKLPSGKPVFFFGIGAPYGMDKRKDQTARVITSEFEYRVTVKTGSVTKELLGKKMQFSPTTLRWEDHSLDLSEFAGQQVQLELRTSTNSAKDHFVAWSSPEIYNISTRKKKPNIILLSIDTLRADRIAQRTAPNLLRFAERSLQYKNAYCTFPSTLPSHASVMTGLYVGNHQVSRPAMQLARMKQIPQKLITVAETAQQAGYFTAGITDGGFVSSFYGFDQGFQQYSENINEKRENVATIGNGIAWLRNNSTRPFFLFLHSYYVHEPFTPPREVFHKLFPEAHPDREPKVSMEWLHKVVSGQTKPTEQDKEFIRRCYDAEVFFFDQNFGKLLDEMRNLKIDRDTVILIFGDHGEQFFDRDDTFGHGKTLAGEEIRVPLILHIPGRKAELREDLVSLVDLYPTLAELMQTTVDAPIDGISLLEATDSKKRFNRAIYYEVSYGNEAVWGAQTREFKLVLDKLKGKEFFYDLRKDPMEKTSLVDSPGRPMKLMKDLLAEYVRKSTTPTDLAKSQQEKQETGELREQLKALGYIN